MSDSADSNPRSKEVLAIWNRIAGWWDQQIGDGNQFQELLIEPATDILLNPQAGQTILDIACGNGQYSRKLGRRGIRVLACDGSEAFVQLAKVRTTPADGEIKYRVIDATNESALLSLGTSHFDSAVCNMAMMDLPTIDPLLRAVKQLLKPSSPFVFSLPHPCFNSNRSRMVAELINEDGKLEQIYGVRITEYIEPTVDRSAGILHQPEPHYIFHRPISVVLESCFNAGFILDGMKEPTYPIGAGAKNAFSWSKRRSIPPAIVFRVR
jgi:2-polyprenyl-3-methyl-5-hydroxy-6-metoxy-1,4-benzoquinol methylase